MIDKIGPPIAKMFAPIIKIIGNSHTKKERVVGVIAKRARGEMARFLIENEIQTTKGIEKFSSMGFKFRDFSNNCFTFVSS